MFSQLRYVQERLAEVGHAGWADVAKATRVPFGTVKNIGSKRTLDPRVKTIDKIAAYFRVKEKRMS